MRSSEHGQWINAHSHKLRNRLAVMWIHMPPCCPVSWIMSIIPACLSFGVVLKRLLCHYKLMSHAVGYTFTARWWGLTDTYWHLLPDARMRLSVHIHTCAASTWPHTGVRWAWVWAFVCMLMDCLLFCPSITPLVKADRAVRQRWQEVRQTGVSVLGSHLPPASAFIQLLCRLLTHSHAAEKVNAKEASWAFLDSISTPQTVILQHKRKVIYI